MKYIQLTATLLAAHTHANILFPFVQPACDFGLSKYQGCLSGQICLSDNT